MLQILKRGSTGPEVERWQTFLRGLAHNSCVVVNGTFDVQTELEPKSFQSRKGLVADGSVGPKTLAAAIQSGYPLMTDSTGDINGPSWPPRPANGPLSPIDRENLFGKFTYISSPTFSNPESITITDSWVSNITQVQIPQLSGIAGFPSTRMISIHKAIANQTVNLFKAWDDAGLTYLILSWAGSWAPRFIRGSRTNLSNHEIGRAHV